jgi:hypothetical protein
MKILISVLLVLCFVAIGSAQERIIGQAEFDSVVAEGGKHRQKWKEKYRMTVTSYAKTDGRPSTDWSSNMTYEYGAPRELRSVTNSMFGEKIIPAKEFITIGNTIYQRTGNGSWTRHDETNETSMPKQTEKTETSAQISGTEIEYKYLGTENLAGKPVQVYLKTERGSSTKENGENVQTTRIAKFWIGADGLIIKSEHSSEGRSGTQTFRTSVISQYELDPTIDITAPKIVS